MKANVAVLQQKIGRGMFSAIIAGALALAFGQSVFAEFARQTGDVGWGYGYGYGWSYGDGWDGGGFSGYLTQEIDAPYNELWRIYGIGYGRMLPHNDSPSDISYDSDTRAYEISGDDFESIFQAGITTPTQPFGPSYGDLSVHHHYAFFMNAPVRVHVGNSSAYLPDKTTYLSCDPPGPQARIYIATSTFSTTGLSNVRGKLAVGFADEPYCGLLDTEFFDPQLTPFSIYVGPSFNSQTLQIMYQAVSDGGFEAVDTCTVSGGYCSFEAAQLGYYAVTGGSSGSHAPVPPSVTLYHPNGGESYNAGSVAHIDWSIGGPGIYRSRISYSSDSGSTWTVVASDLSATSYFWNVPTDTTTHGRILVEGLNSSGSLLASAVSANDFSIVASGGGGGGFGGGGDNGGGNNGTPPGNSHSDRGGVTSHGALNRDDANGRLPNGIPVDSLVKLVDDNDPSTEADTTVYYIGLDAKRHPFPTRGMYDTWYQDFSAVHPIDAITLATIPLGQPILTRPGTRWVKIASDPKTYYIEPGYTLRWIKDEATARILGGPDWNHNIMDVDPSLFSVFTMGPDIDAASLDHDWPSGALVKTAGSDTYYITADGRRTWSNQAAMQANHFQQKFVVTTADGAGWIGRPIGDLITGLEDALFSLMH